MLGPLPEQYLILTAKSSIYCKTKESKYGKKALGCGGFWLVVFCFVYFVCEAGSHYVALGGLELAEYWGQRCVPPHLGLR